MERPIRTKWTFAECFLVRNWWSVEGNTRGFCSDLESFTDGRRVRRLHFTFRDSKRGFIFTAVYHPDCCSNLLKRHRLSALMSRKGDCWLELDRKCTLCHGNTVECRGEKKSMPNSESWPEFKHTDTHCAPIANVVIWLFEVRHE